MQGKLVVNTLIHDKVYPETTQNATSKSAKLNVTIYKVH